MAAKPQITSLQDLADLAGVSRATASRALSNSTKISANTREKIQALARLHGYSVNRRARDLRLKRSSVIAVVFMLDIRSRQHMSDLFFLDMLGAIADSLSERDYDLLLAHAPVVNAADLARGRILNQSDGIIFIGQERQHEHLNSIADDQHPIVVWGQPVEDKRYTVVGGDNFRGGHDATAHLLQQGRKRIAFFGSTANPENAARFAGYRAALDHAGIAFDADLHVDIPFTMEDARRSTTQLLEQRSDFDAVVCVSDVMALAAISALQRKGFGVPDDIAVTGYDDIGLAAYSSPTLTTVRQNIGLAGEKLVETLMAQIDGEKTSDVLIPTKLICRESTVKKP